MNGRIPRTGPNPSSALLSANSASLRFVRYQKTMKARPAPCQKIVDAWKDSLDCGSPAVRLFVSGRPKNKRQLSPDQQVGEQSNARSRASAVQGPGPNPSSALLSANSASLRYVRYQKTMRTRPAPCQKIVDAWKNSLDCGSPAAAFAETALLSGSSLVDARRTKDSFLPIRKSVSKASSQQGCFAQSGSRASAVQGLGLDTSSSRPKKINDSPSIVDPLHQKSMP